MASNAAALMEMRITRRPGTELAADYYGRTADAHVEWFPGAKP